MAVTINYEQIRITELDSYLLDREHTTRYIINGCTYSEERWKARSIFAVWAPAAKDVYVIGEFNDWKAYGYDMKKIFRWWNI